MGKTNQKLFETRYFIYSTALLDYMNNVWYVNIPIMLSTHNLVFRKISSYRFAGLAGCHGYDFRHRLNSSYRIKVSRHTEKMEKKEYSHHTRSQP